MTTRKNRSGYGLCIPLMYLLKIIKSLISNILSVFTLIDCGSFSPRSSAFDIHKIAITCMIL